MEKHKILCIDDSKIVREHLKEQLIQIGSEVILATNGQDGYQLANDNRFDLIITDIEMPGMNGFELCNNIRNGSSNNNTPIIILSGDESDHSIEQGFRVGATAYITKRAARQSLVPKVQSIFDNKAHGDKQVILVVDDSKSIREIVCHGLTEAGYHVISACNGKEAWKILAHTKPELLITDINMPEMTGGELLAAMAGNQEMSAIPVVVMSAESDRSVIKNIAGSGVSNFIAKPFNIDALICSIKKLLADKFKILSLEKTALEHERSMLYNSISSLIQALEARDPYTRGHSESVAYYTVQISKKIYFNNEDIKNIELAAKLHDIGKIGIRDAILLKESKLTRDEFDLIKRHPVISAKILEPISSASIIIPAILHHHEKLDGSGYPDGLRGEAIPRWAQIIAVADVYHALTSVRPYRKQLSSDEALEIMHGMKGNHLSRKFVEVLEQLIATGNLAPAPAEASVSHLRE
jgi:response regulator RpfG family c-di-GMP phosphodiesterase